MAGFSRRKLIKRSLWAAAILFVFMNVMAIFHSYKFTHFLGQEKRTEDPSKLSAGKRINTLLFGVNNPKPRNRKLPAHAFETITIQSNKTIECWSIATAAPKGTVVIFHGYSGDKSSMLDKADEFLAQGYNVLLVDFMGSGGSEGNQTTIGYFESEQVKSCYDYLKKKGEEKIILFGTSMGSVAIMKAIADHDLQPSAIVIECPFGSMYKTVCARFRLMKAPTFPMAGLLVFWGGAQNGFWAFGHNPTKYAERISCPTLLLYGAEDKKVSIEETNGIFKNLKGIKELGIFPDAGHENLFAKDRDRWRKSVFSFIASR
jgi:alpha-beta hydrolase superfamily lysophospholipase